MSFLLNTHLRLAVSSLKRNSGRTFLSALGIAIGVAAIVLIMSITTGINMLIGLNTDKANANLIIVRPSTGRNTAGNLVNELTSNNQYIKSNLTVEDTRLISKIEDVAYVAPLASTTTAIMVGDNSYPSVDVVATTADLADTTSLPLKSGSFITNDVHMENKAVIGYDVATRLFGTTEAVTSFFQYNGHKFMVVGVLEKQESPINYNGIDFDNSIIIDINYAITFEESIQIQQINIRTATTDSTAKVVEDINSTLSARKNGDSTYSILSGSDDFKGQGSLLGIISSMLVLVASISLVIGGVGIMNIMLVTVSERTREIGIRKAVGASSSNIMLQFLYEAIILSAIGGILGILLGYALAFLVSLVTPFAPYVSWQILAITGGTTLVVGVIFGVYPAAKAAHKDPITSLKFYR